VNGRHVEVLPGEPYSFSKSMPDKILIASLVAAGGRRARDGRSSVAFRLHVAVVN